MRKSPVSCFEFAMDAEVSVVGPTLFRVRTVGGKEVIWRWSGMARWFGDEAAQDTSVSEVSQRPRGS